jgi:hypothetical protein
MTGMDNQGTSLGDLVEEMVQKRPKLDAQQKEKHAKEGGFDLMTFWQEGCIYR